ncbi:MAG TPA: translation initiation factor eIF-1A [archaeon]|nr:translation initiation factor eIF-1A [archaeon]
MYHKGSDEPVRIRMPRSDEVLGVVEAMLGASKMRVRCQDEKMRICRIPGRLRKSVWIKEGDVVLIKPWSIQGDRSGDIEFRYTFTQAQVLRKRGALRMD